ncbi:MAG: hypothetical protein MMC33_003921 [Icmadophila ericetorum]|nr:hypothetical protein [Icmadophila ericetorum]
MSHEEQIVAEFNQETGKYWSTHADYEQVHALLLYWTDNDLNVETEVLRLQTLFQGDLGFTVKIYKILRENSAMQLQCELSKYVKQNSLQKRSLTIVYYGGHADEIDDSTKPGYSHWRAKEKGVPTLDWFEIQPTLYHAQGDVLVILNCCHAALKTRGTKTGKMEVLAACGAGSRVPQPGRVSFTSVLIREMRKCLKAGDVINVSRLTRHLWADKTEPALTVTQVYFDLSQHDQRSIVLKPLERPGFAKKQRSTSSFVFLKVPLQEDLTGRQIADWLKSFPPEVIQDVNIEALVLKARRLEGLKCREALFPGSILGKLSESAQLEIRRMNSGLSQVISSTASLANDAEPSVATALSIQEASSNAELTKKVISDIQTNISGVYYSVEGSILSDVDYKWWWLSKAFGVVFEIDMVQNPIEAPVALSNLYKTRHYVPLDLRIALAHTLAIALGNFHKVGWVHKELNSGSILFFRTALASDETTEPVSAYLEYQDIDFCQPRLFGFSCSRPDDGHTRLADDYNTKRNFYRHPERWGKPTAKFKKYHDVYALSIIFLEIAYWKPIKSFEEMKANPLDKWKCSALLLARIATDLPHRVGQNFSDAIKACLDFQTLTGGFDELKIHQEFRRKIIEKLETKGGFS